MSIDDGNGEPVREECHPAQYDYRARFPQLRVVVGVEGGVVYAADGPEGAALISDEGTLAEFLSESDHEDLVPIRLFASAAARDVFAARVQERAQGRRLMADGR